MNARTLALTAATLASLVGAAAPAWAIGGPNAAAVTPAQDTEFWYVGRVQYETNAQNTHNGTGSYIRQGVALTAAHVLNSDTSNGTRFERFQLGDNTTPLFALGVQHPAYNPAGLSSNDIGLMLTLNGPAGHNFPALATAAVPQGGSVEVIGFTDPAGPSAKRRGTLTIRNPHNGDITASTYAYRAAGTDWTNGGDSGGPHVYNFGPGPGNGKRIAAITRNGNGAGFSQAVRVDPHLGFIAGQGVGGERVFDTWTAGAGNWGNNASWSRAGVGAAKPAAGDVAILDPTTGADNGTIVTVNENTANLDGLLTDVHLRVTDKTLRVDSAPANGLIPGSGVLNGGRIEVGAGAAGALGIVSSAWSFENVGSVDIHHRGAVTIGHAGALGDQTVLRNNAGATITAEGNNDADGAATLRVHRATDNLGTITSKAKGDMRFGIATTGAEIALHNQNGATILADGGDIHAHTRTVNDGTITVKKGGKLNLGSNLPATVGAGNLPIAINQRATLTVDSGGTLTATNGAHKSAYFQNTVDGVFTVRGGADGAGTANLDYLGNSGEVYVRSGAVVNTSRETANLAGGIMLLQGGASGDGVLNSGVFFNEGPAAAGDPGAHMRIVKGGRLNAERPAALGAGPAFVNQADASVAIDAGGRATVRGRAVNDGALRIEANDGDGPAQFNAFKTTAGVRGEFTNRGALEFQHVGAGTKPEFVTFDADFVNELTVTGAGRFSLTGETNFLNKAPAGANNWNDLDLIYDSAFTAANNFVELEVSNTDSGALLAGLMQPFAIETLCLVGNSLVKLVDAFANEGAAGTEAMYVEKLGVAMGSMLDLAGRTLYYKDVLPGHGLEGVVMNGGQLVQIPTPGALALLTLACGMAIRRRRETTTGADIAA